MFTIPTYLFTDSQLFPPFLIMLGLPNHFIEVFMLLSLTTGEGKLLSRPVPSDGIPTVPISDCPLVLSSLASLVLLPRSLAPSFLSYSHRVRL
jgi:hypothetical protein